MSSKLVLVDSSGWIEYFVDAAGASNFSPAILATDSLIVSPIAIYEVSRFFRARHDARAGQAAAAQMNLGLAAPLDSKIATDAAALAVAHHLAMADAMILATARAHGAELWTQDADFGGLEGVRYFPKSS